jgi:hypothetical protein
MTQQKVETTKQTRRSVELQELPQPLEWLSEEQAEQVEGGAYRHQKAFEIKDFSFGVENPTTIG